MFFSNQIDFLQIILPTIQIAEELGSNWSVAGFTWAIRGTARAGIGAAAEQRNNASMN
jgi:hypothetical protein